jgi:Protein of unknown function (DUF2490)
MNKYILSFILFMPLITKAQTTDTGLWTGVNTKKRITKKISVSLNGQHRLAQNFSVTKSWIGEAGLSYKIVKGLEVSAMYRYIYFNDYKPKKQIYVYESRHRFYGDIAYQFSVKSFNIENRLRYQNQFKDNAGVLVEDKNYLRYKIGVEYDTDSRLTPLLSSDFFYQLGGAGLDQVRVKAGINIKTFKGQSIDIAPFMNLPINDPTSNKELIVQLNYKVKF